MLNEIIKYIEDNKIVSLYDLTIHFKTEESALEKMLEKLAEKGRIRKRDSIKCDLKCEGCVKANCLPSKLVFYEKT